MSISTPLEVTATGQQIEVPSVEDAKAMITDKYNSIIMTAPATVEEISLEYINDSRPRHLGSILADHC